MYIWYKSSNLIWLSWQNIWEFGNTPRIDVLTKLWNPLSSLYRWGQLIFGSYRWYLFLCYTYFRNNIILSQLVWLISLGLFDVIPLQWIKLGLMTPPSPMQCSYLGCDYSTPTSIPTYEHLLKALELHVNSAHTVSRSTDHANNPKVEKPKRPQVQANMSESDWVFFEHKWARYQRQSKITGQQVIDELWACLDVDLER